MKNPLPAWHPQWAAASPLYADIAQLLAPIATEQWPTAAVLNDAWLPTAAPQAVANDVLQDSELYYEQYIYQHQQLPTRDNWHDFFNAAMWSLYPQAKQQMNKRHVAAMTQAHNGGAKRGKVRDGLTLLDECGAVVAYSDASWPALWRQHQWHSLFVARRDDWWQQIRPFIIGHALLEQAWHPYLGWCGKALLVQVPQTFWTRSLAEQYQWLDDHLAQALLQADWPTPGALLPLPVLGVPGWWAANTDPAFYDNTDYFRPAPQRARYS